MGPHSPQRIQTAKSRCPASPPGMCSEHDVGRGPASDCSGRAGNALLTAQPGARTAPLGRQLRTRCQSHPPQGVRLLDRLWDTCAWVSGTELQVRPAARHSPHVTVFTVFQDRHRPSHTSSPRPRGQHPSSPRALGFRFRGLPVYAWVAATWSPVQTPPDQPTEAVPWSHSPHGPVSMLDAIDPFIWLPGPEGLSLEQDRECS